MTNLLPLLNMCFWVRSSAVDYVALDLESVYGIIDYGIHIQTLQVLF